jgi:hypothetical protein
VDSSDTEDTTEESEDDAPPSPRRGLPPSLERLLSLRTRRPPAFGAADEAAAEGGGAGSDAEDGAEDDADAEDCSGYGTDDSEDDAAAAAGEGGAAPSSIAAAARAAFRAGASAAAWRRRLLELASLPTVAQIELPAPSWRVFAGRGRLRLSGQLRAPAAEAVKAGGPLHVRLVSADGCELPGGAGAGAGAGAAGPTWRLAVKRSNVQQYLVTCEALAGYRVVAQYGGGQAGAHGGAVMWLQGPSAEVLAARRAKEAAGVEARAAADEEARHVLRQLGAALGALPTVAQIELPAPSWRVFAGRGALNLSGQLCAPAAEAVKAGEPLYVRLVSVGGCELPRSAGAGAGAAGPTWRLAVKRSNRTYSVQCQALAGYRVVAQYGGGQAGAHGGAVMWLQGPSAEVLAARRAKEAASEAADDEARQLLRQLGASPGALPTVARIELPAPSSRVFGGRGALQLSGQLCAPAAEAVKAGEPLHVRLVSVGGCELPRGAGAGAGAAGPTWRLAVKRSSTVYSVTCQALAGYRVVAQYGGGQAGAHGGAVMWLQGPVKRQ